MCRTPTPMPERHKHTSQVRNLTRYYSEIFSCQPLKTRKLPNKPPAQLIAHSRFNERGLAAAELVKLRRQAPGALKLRAADLGAISAAEAAIFLI